MLERESEAPACSLCGWPPPSQGGFVSAQRCSLIHANGTKAGYLTFKQRGFTRHGEAAWGGEVGGSQRAPPSVRRPAGEEAQEATPAPTVLLPSLTILRGSAHLYKGGWH